MSMARSVAATPAPRTARPSLPQFAGVAPADAIREAAALLRQPDMHALSALPMRVTAAEAVTRYTNRQKATVLSGLLIPGLVELIAALSAVPADAAVDITHMTSRAGYVSMFVGGNGAPLGLIVLPPAPN
jgi:hypothetical protein